MDFKKKTNGRMIFFATLTGIGYYVTSQEDTKNTIELKFSDELGYSQGFRDSLIESVMNVDIKGTIISGKNFADGIKNNTYTNANGKMVCIFIDDYLTNLGIVGDKFLQGKFLVNENYFRNICNSHKVEVNWLEDGSCPILFNE